MGGFGPKSDCIDWANGDNFDNLYICIFLYLYLKYYINFNINFFIHIILTHGVISEI